MYLKYVFKKREAEEAIYEIREGLYDDCYKMITPIHYIDEDGNQHDEFPNTNALIEAYWIGDYSSFGER